MAGCDRRPAPPPLVPQVSGTLALDGVSAPVRIVRDQWGVPHIYAQNADDLFFAQGFVQAQDRLFQMDVWRRSVQGRLSEVLGANFIERDAMTRRVQYRGDLEAEWSSYAPDARSIAAAFVRGINAWVALARERPPEEFALAGWNPEFWSPEDLLNRTDAFTSDGHALEEIFAARLVAVAGPRRAAAILGSAGPIVVPRGLDLMTISYVIDEAIRRVGTPPFFVGLATQVRLPADTPGIVPAPPADPAHPAQAAVSLPLPSPRYLVHLIAPGWNVSGATAPWLPGVAIGHNDRVAWTMTAFDADTEDVYVEKVNPANPRQVDDSGRWADTQIIKDAIVVRGRAKPFEFDSERTRHGVVVASDRERHLAFTLRWSGAEPGAAAALAALAIDRAQSAAAFREALGRWKMPARKVTFVDVDGRGGSQAAALIPRRQSWSGAVPVPGWTGDYEWNGWRAFSDLPGDERPRGGAIATSDEAPTPPRLLAWLVRAHPDRAERILQRPADAETVLAAAREARPAVPVLFAHPLGVTDAARRRFNVGPMSVASSSGGPFRATFDPQDWDRSIAINAPGQSASPNSNHFSDMARRWAAGESIPLWFSERAVRDHAAATLTLDVRLKPGATGK